MPSAAKSSFKSDINLRHTCTICQSFFAVITQCKVVRQKAFDQSEHEQQPSIHSQLGVFHGGEKVKHPFQLIKSARHSAWVAFQIPSSRRSTVPAKHLSSVDNFEYILNVQWHQLTSTTWYRPSSHHATFLRFISKRQTRKGNCLDDDLSLHRSF